VEEEKWGALHPKAQQSSQVSAYQRQWPREESNLRPQIRS
jgi:hypothetical protein